MLQKIILSLTFVVCTSSFAQEESSIEFFDLGNNPAFSIGWTVPIGASTANYFNIQNNLPIGVNGEMRYLPQTDASGSFSNASIDFNGLKVHSSELIGAISKSKNTYVTSSSIMVDKNDNGTLLKAELRAGALQVDTVLASALVTTPKWKIPDYVFADDYQLQPLAQVELFVKENKHLPEIPSEADIKKNGLDLVQMNILLLKKIEELTLHTIALNKQMQYQASELQKLKGM